MTNERKPDPPELPEEVERIPEKPSSTEFAPPPGPPPPPPPAPKPGF